MTRRLSLTTILRRAVADLVSASTEMQALCGRADNLVIAASSIAPAQLPVVAMLVEQDERAGGMGDRRRAVVRLVACAVDRDTNTLAHDIAESMTEVCRDVIGSEGRRSALESYELDGEALLEVVHVDFSRRDLDPIEFTEVPAQFASKEIVFTVTATVLVPTAVA